MSVWRTAVVVGASSGIGLALARALAAGGTRVALVARRGEDLAAECARLNAGRATPIAFAYPHDVRDLDAIPGLAQQIAHDLEGLDLLIYAAGIMPPSAPGGYDTARDAEILTTNLIGAFGWLNEAARRFAQTRRGTIIGVSSVAGDRGRRAMPAYAASKAALTTYLEALRNRLATRGVTVVTVKPGYVATPLLAGAKIPRFLPVITPERAARLILAAARRRGGATAYIPGVWRPIMALVRALPSPLMRRLNI